MCDDRDASRRIQQTVGAAQQAFLAWRDVPAPKRGEVVRRYAEALRAASRRDLGRLVTLEAGKILAEGEGEVQEMIDICDLAVGLSRQLHGLTIASERPAHRLMEQWHPLGVVASSRPSISRRRCGRGTARSPWCAVTRSIWKPSEKTPLTAIACVRLAERVCRELGVDPASSRSCCGDGATRVSR